MHHVKFKLISTMRRNTRKTIFIFVSILMMYLFIRVKNYDFEMTGTIPKAAPHEVWEFVADFSNMKYLNPTITDFIVTDESNDYNHWQYNVEYSENLSHWPHLPNYNTATVHVKEEPKDATYLIISIHKTCMFSGLYCLESEGTFRFTSSKMGTTVEEAVRYQCPVFLSTFCRREVMYQRRTIMENLKNKFV